MPPRDEVVNSMIGEGSVFQGKFFVNGSLQVDGRFEGEIRTQEHLIVGETGKIKTEVIRAKKITIAGTVIGDVKAIEEVRLISTGRVLGNIETPQMIMEPGVVVKGNILINGGQKKDVEKLIEDAFNAGAHENIEAIFGDKPARLSGTSDLKNNSSSGRDL